MDVLANEAMKQAFGNTGRVSIMASEEEPDPIPAAEGGDSAKYVLLFDPLDGSSNIDVNVSIGTIFSIQQRLSQEGCGDLVDCLQAGRSQVAAGYVIYGSSTVLVYSAGHGVHCFTLDPVIGEFRLTNQNVTTPRRGKYYSINESNFTRWSPGYPALADTKHNKTILDLLNATENIGLNITEVGEFSPTGSTAAVVSFHPEARFT